MNHFQISPLKFAIIYAAVFYVLGYVTLIPALGILETVIFSLSPSFLHLYILRPVYAMFYQNFSYLGLPFGFFINYIFGLLGGKVVLIFTSGKLSNKQFVILSFIVLLAISNVLNAVFVFEESQENPVPIVVLGMLPFSIIALSLFVYKIFIIKKRSP
ncbi:hypothetical protein A2567_02625 [Candidatus Azambacteria bacterium RIFOXYD1_FULL_42_11]|uniref:Uncharacterized protein n=3 Tax=Candidatus Azamiibacteriota TaxID=1752741 RepID=A0A0G0ZB93_9BACT|nr:MAG: hypothetical protein UV07_C0007G0035 [Candidatus Azambacteria bacterium GW2011_GWB1_42_17]KKS45934.1 MAG: hypothetical protein UV10_C0011G0020 [Candidatus Azambacteria bacterium GW2011_GWA1_42_19]KKS88655.1 MAG: hypothetical protein UV62_C0004G0044 [Parcubacteria group bacterium GW2011_GWC1_43_11]OGD43325.1 MAG: hypothetical protein A2567_02625 [Candidatus Azambacteria bacterium RIFOXYD1_FULL_42_11]